MFHKIKRGITQAMRGAKDACVDILNAKQASMQFAVETTKEVLGSCDHDAWVRAGIIVTGIGLGISVVGASIIACGCFTNPV